MWTTCSKCHYGQFEPQYFTKAFSPKVPCVQLFPSIKPVASIHIIFIIQAFGVCGSINHITLHVRLFIVGFTTPNKSLQCDCQKHARWIAFRQWMARRKAKPVEKKHLRHV